MTCHLTFIFKANIKNYQMQLQGYIYIYVYEDKTKKLQFQISKAYSLNAVWIFYFFPAAAASSGKFWWRGLRPNSALKSRSSDRDSGLVPVQTCALLHQRRHCYLLLASFGVGQLVVLLPAHASVLEPNLDLALGQAQHVGNLDPAAAREVATEVELFLQLQYLLARVSRA